MTLFLAALLFAPQAAIPPQEEVDTYAIYSLLLKDELSRRTGESTPAIIRQTERGRLPMCVHPPADQKAIYTPLTEDFESRNARSFTLEAKLDLSTYKFIPREDAAAFLKENPRSGVVLEVSAPGYNADRSRALVYVGHRCGSLCGGGTYHLLVKREGKWQRDTEFRGGPFCAWVS